MSPWAASLPWDRAGRLPLPWEHTGTAPEVTEAAEAGGSWARRQLLADASAAELDQLAAQAGLAAELDQLAGLDDPEVWPWA